MKLENNIVNGLMTVQTSDFLKHIISSAL